ncbi:MAG: hypothetical protein ACRESW_07405, partial [Nevskiales bacterium]
MAATLGFLAGRAPATGMPAAATVSALPEPAPIADAAGFIQAVAGDWLGPGEQLLIRHDKGVVEILRQTRADKGEVRLDQY